MFKLFLPTRIKVGFQERRDTYTNKLGYVIYYDKKVLKKEKSFETWRDEKIDTEEYDNNPRSGFCINKSVTRGGWDHFSQRTTNVRILDPRGFEFEITPQNLIFILEHYSIIGKEIMGDLVYGWGTDLILLPTNSADYDNCVNYTKLKHTSVSTKTYVLGDYYKTLNGNSYMYCGRANWYVNNNGWKTNNFFKKTVIKNAHIFKPINIETLSFLEGFDKNLKIVEHIPNNDSFSVEKSYEQLTIFQKGCNGSTFLGLSIEDTTWDNYEKFEDFFVKDNAGNVYYFNKSEHWYLTRNGIKSISTIEDKIKHIEKEGVYLYKINIEYKNSDNWNNYATSIDYSYSKNHNDYNYINRTDNYATKCLTIFDIFTDKKIDVKKFKEYFTPVVLYLNYENCKIISKEIKLKKYE